MKKTLIAAAAIAVMFSGTAFADEIADRKAMMKKVGGAMGTVAGMVKGEKDYDQAMAVAAFTTMNEVATGIGDLFPEGTETGGETTAAPKIWEDMEGFKAALAKFAADSSAAAEANPADLDAMKVVFGPVAQNCSACHQEYRIKKD